MINSAILTGRLTRDPDVRQSGDTTIARFTLAVDRRFKREGQPDADFISCIAFGNTAEFIQNYFHKGMKMEVEGRIQTGHYTNKDGNEVYTTDVVCNNVGFAESKKYSEANSNGESMDNSFMDIPDGSNEELPFN